MIILAPGFYWVDAFPDESGAFPFDAWLSSSRGVVRLISTTPHLPERQWHLFEVKFPAPWPPPAKTSNPSRAPRGAATTEDDTRNAPELTPGNFFEDLLRGVATGGIGGGLLLLAGLLLLGGGKQRLGRRVF